MAMGSDPFSAAVSSILSGAGGQAEYQTVSARLSVLARWACQSVGVVGKEEDIVSELLERMCSGEISDKQAPGSDLAQYLTGWAYRFAQNASKRDVRYVFVGEDEHVLESFLYENGGGYQIEYDLDTGKSQEILSIMQQNISTLDMMISDYGESPRKRKTSHKNEERKVRDVVYAEVVRERCGFSQQEWAELLGIPYSRYRSYVKGKANTPPYINEQATHLGQNFRDREALADKLRNITMPEFAALLTKKLGGAHEVVHVLGISQKTLKRWQDGRTSIPLSEKIYRYAQTTDTSSRGSSSSTYRANWTGTGRNIERTASQETA